jgi:hypothetical protein
VSPLHTCAYCYKKTMRQSDTPSLPPTSTLTLTLALRYGAGLHVGRKADHIIVFNRRTGLFEEETIDPALAFSMKALYQTYGSACHSAFECACM